MSYNCSSVTQRHGVIMKSQKRNRLERAYNAGYKAGIRGRSYVHCPYELAQKRGCWMGGWREGRDNFMSGYVDLECV